MEIPAGRPACRGSQPRGRRCAEADRAFRPRSDSTAARWGHWAGAGRQYRARMNRLAQETSPYLLQHADNPVDWYAWGDEAFAKARAEEKPILLSIGYAA